MSKSKKEFNNALLKWLYGVENMDEYRYQQVALIGNTCFIIYFFGSLLSILIGVGLNSFNSDWGFHFLLFSHLILGAVTSLYLTHQCSKRGFLIVEVLPENYETEKYKRLKRNRRNSMIYFLVYTIFTSFMNNGFRFNHLLVELLSMPKLINALIVTLVFNHFTKKELLKNLRILDESDA